MANGAIGLNWGRQNAQRLLPSTVVDLMLHNNVRQARIYSSEEDILSAFCGSGINLTVSAFGVNGVATMAGAQKWVAKNIPFFGPANIRGVFIGNFMYDESNVTKSIKLFEDHMNAMKSVQGALDAFVYGDGVDVRTNVPIPHNVLKNKIARPSDAEFRDEMKPLISETLRYLAARGLPVVVQMFPILYLKSNNLDLDFAFVGSGSRYAVRDVGGAVYNNVFEFMYDSFVWALEKAGAPASMEVVVGHIGWPTDGYPGANASTAERFYKGLLPLVAGNKGTPKRPGRPIDTYLHSLTDEPKNSVGSQPFARHWGIFRSNGEPKYKIDLSGQGRDIFPTRARGIQHMPERWCMYKESTGKNDISKVQEQVAKACKGADCTATFPGGSCSELSFQMNVSYAFNMYFQSRFQEERACLFEGLAHVVSHTNPSTGTCVFPVEVVKGQQKQFITSAGERLHHHHQLPGSPALMFFFLLFTSIHWVF